MLPVGGRPILEHLIDLLRSHGVTEIAINLHYKPDAIVEYFGDGTRCGVSITYSLERELLGSAGAVKQLEAFFTDTFLVLYGDVLTNLDLTGLVGQHQSTGAQVTVALYEAEDPTRCGIVELTAEGRIVRFVEKPAPGAVFSNLANAGIYVVEPEVIGQIPAGQPFDFGRDLFPVLIEQGLALQGHCAPGYILDVGSPERYRQAEADWQAGRFAPIVPIGRPATRLATREVPGF